MFNGPVGLVPVGGDAGMNRDVNCGLSRVAIVGDILIRIVATFARHYTQDGKKKGAKRAF